MGTAKSISNPHKGTTVAIAHTALVLPLTVARANKSCVGINKLHLIFMVYHLEGVKTM